jgi:signal peptidase II
VGRPLHRLRARTRALTEPAPPRPLDVRVGSSTNGLVPISVAERSLSAGPSEWAALAAIAGSAVLADQVTKRIVASQLALGDSRHVVGPFDLHHVQNSGIAFGLFPRATTIVIVLTSIVIAWLLVVFARSGARHPVLPVGLGLLVGGSLSNLADRIRLGHVTDFLDLDFWPAFNLADTFIVVGVALLVGAAVIGDRPRSRPR